MIKIATGTVKETFRFEVGRKVRQIIRELGGQMPETLPASENISASRNLKKN